MKGERGGGFFWGGEKDRKVRKRQEIQPVQLEGKQKVPGVRLFF